MQRPARLFLVRSTFPIGSGSIHYSLVWKTGRQVLRIPAGMVGPAPTPCDSSNDDPPTVDSIIDDLHRSPDYPLESNLLEAWDVSDRVGRYYPRIRRGEIFAGHFDTQVNLTVAACNLVPALVSSIVAAERRLDELDEVCGVVEPDVAQLSVYGHRLRLLLINACTEVESSWRSVYVANHPAPPQRLNTNQYVRLADAMRLREWSVLFTRIAPAREIRPFATWNAADPTGTLPWYDAYNMTKHNREEHLDQATLGHAVEALAALYILLLAQFGYEAKNALPEHPFTLHNVPEWDHEHRYIQSPFDDGPWQQAQLFAGPP